MDFAWNLLKRTFTSNSRKSSLKSYYGKLQELSPKKNLTKHLTIWSKLILGQFLDFMQTCILCIGLNCTSAVVDIVTSHQILPNHSMQSYFLYVKCLYSYIGIAWEYLFDIDRLVLSKVSTWSKYTWYHRQKGCNINSTCKKPPSTALSNQTLYRHAIWGQIKSNLTWVLSQHQATDLQLSTIASNWYSMWLFYRNYC